MLAFEQSDSDIDYPDYHFDHENDVPWSDVLRGIGHAAYTLFNVPDHDSSLYEDLALELKEWPQTLNDPVETECSRVSNLISDRANITALRTLEAKDIAGLLGVLMQFTSYDYSGHLKPSAETSFWQIDKLYSSITEHPNQPLNFSDQLALATAQTDGDIPEALWRLFITSRQHARWFDSDVIRGLPNFSREEKLDRMQKFSLAVRACKPYQEEYAQDSSGDNYYVWTHALGAAAFSALAKKSIFTNLSSTFIKNGTHLMHGLAHRFKPQRLPSNHVVASIYGNAIGQTIASTLIEKAGINKIEVL